MKMCFLTKLKPPCECDQINPKIGGFNRYFEAVFDMDICGVKTAIMCGSSSPVILTQTWTLNIAPEGVREVLKS
jgi:hypothetical protein